MPEAQTSNLTATVQIITGSYERALHGTLATINGDGTSNSVNFSTNFLISGHVSSIRCLAISDPSDPSLEAPSRRILATGGADERINLYQIAGSLPPVSTKADPLAPSASQNRELGSLLHHSSTITTLSFPSRGKLLSAALDNKIAISRVRDWTVLSEIRAPIPKVQGRPSGDTATPGEVPAGINDVAVHPSSKLALSVGQGERCMRLWNLVTGKKAGVLAFERPVLTALDEGRWRGGEARGVVWSPDGDEFAVQFEKGAVIYDLACTVLGIAKVEGSKICRLMYLPEPEKDSRNGKSNGTSIREPVRILAMSTEDGRILFYDTNPIDGAKATSATAMEDAAQGKKKSSKLPTCRCTAQLGEQTRGSRIKDFKLLRSSESKQEVFVVTGTSDGTIRVWSVDVPSLTTVTETAGGETSQKKSQNVALEARTVQLAVKQVGALLGAYESRARITCLEAFIMLPAARKGDADANGTRIFTPAGHADEGGDDWGGFDSDEG